MGHTTPWLLHSQAVFCGEMKMTLFFTFLLCIAAGAISAESDTEGNVTRTPEAVLSAFYYAYPEKITRITRNADTWKIEIGSSVFSWAEGRLLPVNASKSWSECSAYPFYTYPPGLPPIIEPSPERKRLIEERIDNRENNPPSRHPGIYNAIWRVENETSAWNQSKTTFMFGHKLMIHRDLLDELAAIEEELVARASGDREPLAYIESIRSIAGYSWRRIADTASLSYHSYGAAVDFLSKSTGRKSVYWLWRKDLGVNFSS